MIVFAVYRCDDPGPVDDGGHGMTCVAVFGDVEDAIAEVRLQLLAGYSASVDIGAMTEAEWNALEEVPDDFAFRYPASAGALDPHVLQFRKVARGLANRD